MDGRKRESGAKYRKLREEKEQKEAAVLNKIRKIDTFFTPKQNKNDENAGKIFQYSKFNITKFDFFILNTYYI